MQSNTCNAAGRFAACELTSTADEFRTSDFVVFLNPGDGLYRESLVNLRETIRKNPTADVIYGDSAHATGIKAEPLSFAAPTRLVARAIAQRIVMLAKPSLLEPR